MGLTQFEESSREIQILAPPGTDRPLSDPYNTPTPSQLIGKMYNIANLIWTPGWAGAIMAFPFLILSVIQTIQKVLTRYRFFRADVVVEFKMNSTPFHQGALIIGWLPCSNSLGLPTPNTTIPSDKFLLSGMNGVVLSASTQDSLKLKIPYMWPSDYLDLVMAPTTLQDGRIATVHVRELNTLTATSANIGTSIPITVFAGFENIKVAGYISQMDSTNKESTKKAEIGFDAKTVVSSVSKVIRSFPIIGKPYGMLADLANTYAGDLSKPLSNATAAPMRLVYLKESALAHANTYAEQTSLYANALVTQSPTFFGMKTSHLSITELAQRPMLIAQQTFNGTTVYTCTMRATPTNFTLTSISGGTSTTIGDWLSNLSQPFEFWRGSIKYALHFCVPAFYSFRVRIAITQQTALLIDPGDVPSTVIDVKGDTWYEFSVPYLYSTSWRRPYFDHTLANTQVPTITISTITPIVGSAAPATPVVYMNVFRSGGPDTQFGRLRGVRPSTAPFRKEPAVSQVSLDEKFSKGFPGLVDGVMGGVELGLVMCETVKTVSDCLKRYSNWIPGSLIGDSNTGPWGFPPGLLNVNYYVLAGEPYNYFSAFFRFWRGSRIIRHNQPCDLIGLNNDSSIITFGDGGATMFVDETNSLYNDETISIPYYSIIPYQPILSPAQSNTYSPQINQDLYGTYLPTDYYGIADSQANMSIQAGDDFMCLYPVPFFPLYFSPVYFGISYPSVTSATAAANKPSSTNYRS